MHVIGRVQNQNPKIEDPRFPAVKNSDMAQQIDPSYQLPRVKSNGGWKNRPELPNTSGQLPLIDCDPGN